MENKKWYKKLNVVDYFVVVIIITIITGVAFKGGIWDKISTATKIEENISVTLIAKDFDAALFGLFHKGDKVYDSENGVEIGQIVNVTKTDYKEQIELPDGKIALISQPDRIDVKVTITSKGTSSVDGYFVNGRYLGSNSLINLSTKYLQFSPVISDVTLEKQP